MPKQIKELLQILLRLKILLEEANSFFTEWMNQSSSIPDCQSWAVDNKDRELCSSILRALFLHDKSFETASTLTLVTRSRHQRTFAHGSKTDATCDGIYHKLPSQSVSIEMGEAGRCVAWLCYQQLATSNPSTLINLVDRVTRVLSKHLDSEIPVDCSILPAKEPTQSVG